MADFAPGGKKFDSYTESYKEIINRSARLSGERYEYFAELRLRLMQRELASRTGREDGFSILDFGCGIGETALIFRGIFPQSRLTGVDESGESLAKAASLDLAETRFAAAEGNRLPLADEEFDAVYSNGTFHHIPWDRHVDIMGELRRTVKPGGYLFIFENNPRNPLMMQAMNANPFDAGLKAIPPDLLISDGTRAGLSPAGTRFYFFFPRILKVLRPLEKYLGKVPYGAQYYVLFEKQVTGS